MLNSSHPLIPSCLCPFLASSAEITAVYLVIRCHQWPLIVPWHGQVDFPPQLVAEGGKSRQLQLKRLWTITEHITKFLKYFGANPNLTIVCLATLTFFDASTGFLITSWWSYIRGIFPLSYYLLFNEIKVVTPRPWNDNAYSSAPKWKALLSIKISLDDLNDLIWVNWKERLEHIDTEDKAFKNIIETERCLSGRLSHDFILTF